ncbi:class I mannose-6-phosphate isomerase [Sphingomonas sp. ID0503]|uniref:class I mannose-6-phosphate isomerase n=1 Tax=Sphingomonas sp. ID0503 TaxID=3399691 RepID=UPI003AFB5211
MTVTRLETRRVEKPWGRRKLWPGFDDVVDGGEPVGEIWFQHPGEDPELLVKYLFTSEKLSIQDHPSDEFAREKGYPRGKSEAWVILDAEPHATIALGMREVYTREQLRQGALDGSIEDMVDWKSVKANDSIFSPAGTVHAIGPGLTLIEVQQNVDLTYRLYDYGRPRELHLEDGIAVADPVPYVAPFIPMEAERGRTILVDSDAFVMERWTREGSGRFAAVEGRPVWLVPISGGGTADGETISAGGVWLADGPFDLTLEPETDLVIAYPGKGVLHSPW